MEGTTLVIVALLIVLVSIWLSFSKTSLKGLSGPWTNGLPIMGSLRVMRSKPFEKLTELSKKYGPVYRSSSISRTDFSFQRYAKYFNNLQKL
ncbi:hypothetical protein AVEN_181343-1 [Araneus ventricosus]|uniref:Uncharacterized protein n=1 Tax=Araneus ventricosus TaxID=182803 RepID=A0A4Y2SS24_ARAVE|nr:hypothetical protein AVEN_181343-1 [Araneus ventricosus]